MKFMGGFCSGREINFGLSNGYKTSTKLGFFLTSVFDLGNKIKKCSIPHVFRTYMYVI
jgi:hypothetical protein